MDAHKEKNIDNFNRDVDDGGSYQYTGSKLSAVFLNRNISRALASAYPYKGASVIDLGCGDGAYTPEYAAMGAATVLGIDPAASAVGAAERRARENNLNVRYMVGDIYDLQIKERFDCAVLRGVLHHLPDPARAVAIAAGLADAVVILEPNGLNPVLKILEKISKYHVEHGEKSYSPRSLRQWCRDAGLRVELFRHINLVPCFCPDWMAGLLNFLTPLMEKIPLLRVFCLGQVVIVARRGKRMDGALHQQEPGRGLK
jgi:2-polyprenyl-3-methyl-5-hydroxy-6-metoxy-1,4-benzoquinol methylase